MRRFLLAFLLLITSASSASALTLADSTGVIRVFGDASSWMSACFVVGDGSWAITTSEAVTEKVGPDTEQVVRYPVFVSAYTGQAYQCELKARDEDLDIALLKLPVKGLPAAPLAKLDEFSKARYGTMGELMSGDKMGNAWPTEAYGVTREKDSEAGYRLTVGQWNAEKVFVTDIGKYRWALVSDITPDKPIPNGSLVAHGNSAVGMYLKKLTITGGREDVVYGWCAMSTEIARYLGDHGVDTAALYEPPEATIQREEGSDKVFQLQARIYSCIGAGKPALAREPAAALVELRPKDAQARMVLGLALTDAGKFEEALKTLDEAAKLEPKLPGLRMNRALALVGLKKTDEAEAELLKAVEEAPLDVRPVTALADFYMGNEKTYDKALTWAEKAAAMAPQSPAALLLVARAEKRKKDYQQAANSIGEALKMAPDWGEAWYALGATYEEAGDNALAEKAYRALAEKQPKNPDSLLTLASFLADTGKKDEAAEVIGKVRDLKPPKLVLEAAQAIEDYINGKQPVPEDKAEAAPTQ